MSFTIVSLSERPDLAETCAAWSYGEWGSQVFDRTLMQVYADYQESARDDTLPETWVALTEDRKPAGMVRLKARDHVDREDLTPWLSSVYVHPRYRGHGLSRTLLRYAETTAKEKYGFDQIYLFTGSAEALYAKNGYKTIGTVRDQSGFKKDGEPLMMKRLDGNDV